MDAILFRLEQGGLDRKVLERSIGPRGRVSEILSRRRSLTLPMIRRLNRELGLPTEVLIAGPA
jgi:HTH-type transcriptional regulator/antitoxin HigA